MRPILHVPRHPLRLARFGLPAATPATLLARKFRTEQARALWGGCAAHAFSPLSQPMSSSVGMALICAGHAYGWPVARGGSRAISATLWPPCRRARRADRDRAAGGALAGAAARPTRSCSTLRPARSPRSPARGCRRASRGHTVVTGTARERSRSTSPSRAACRGRTRPRARRAPCTRAARSRRSSRGSALVNRGRMPERPFVLVCQQSLADPTRARDDVHPVWAYAHVPSGYTGDATEALIDQIERFAPGLRERILAQSRALDGRDRARQRQLRRRRHHHRREHAVADRDPPAPGARPLQHRHPGRLHLLRRDSSGGRRARDERLQRGEIGACRPGRVRSKRNGGQATGRAGELR